MTEVYLSNLSIINEFLMTYIGDTHGKGLAFRRRNSLGARRQEALGLYTGSFYACVAEVTRQLQTAAYAQREIFANVQATDL